MTTLGEQIAVARARLPTSAAVLSWPLAVAAAFVIWLVTPRPLLHRDLSWRELVPSGIFGMLVSAAVRGLSRWAMPKWITQYAQPFGLIGVAMGIVFWMLLTCSSWVLIAAATAVGWERRARPDEVGSLEGRRDAPADDDLGT